MPFGIAGGHRVSQTMRGMVAGMGLRRAFSIWGGLVRLLIVATAAVLALKIAVRLRESPWEWYAAKRTATVQAIKSNGNWAGGAVYYLNDGTVWAGESSGFLVVEGDKIRYQYLGGLAPNECFLVNTTHGTYTLGLKLSSPFPKTSCPAK